MKTLTLMRHAKSDWNHPGLVDHERPLNQRGQRAAADMAARLASRWSTAGKPDLLISSYAVRAQTTAQCVATALGLPLNTDKHLYPFVGSDVAQLLTNKDSQLQHLMLFGHNPGISHLALTLGAIGAAEMPTAAVVSMQFEAEDWGAVLHSKTSSYWFDCPKGGVV